MILEKGITLDSNWFQNMIQIRFKTIQIESTQDSILIHISLKDNSCDSKLGSNMIQNLFQ